MSGSGLELYHITFKPINFIALTLMLCSKQKIDKSKPCLRCTLGKASFFMIKSQITSNIWNTTCSQNSTSLLSNHFYIHYEKQIECMSYNTNMCYKLNDVRQLHNTVWVSNYRRYRNIIKHWCNTLIQQKSCSHHHVELNK